MESKAASACTKMWGTAYFWRTGMECPTRRDVGTVGNAGNLKRFEKMWGPALFFGEPTSGFYMFNSRNRPPRAEAKVRSSPGWICCVSAEFAVIRCKVPDVYQTSHWFVIRLLLLAAIIGPQHLTFCCKSRQRKTAPTSRNGINSHGYGSLFKEMR